MNVSDDRIFAIEKLLTDFYAADFMRRDDPAEAVSRWRAVLDKQGSIATFPELTPEQSDHRADEVHTHMLRLADDTVGKVSRLLLKRSR